MAIYPDAEGEAIVTVADENQYKSLSYQWQKLVGGEWKNMPAFKTNKLTIANASAADKGTYRCRVNAIYFDTTSQKEFSISAYTDALETVYTKRTPEAVMTVKAEQYGTNKDINGIYGDITLHSANYNNSTAPKGSVTFNIEGKNFENTITKALSPSTNKASTIQLQVSTLRALQRAHILSSTTTAETMSSRTKLRKSARSWLSATHRVMFLT